MAITLQCADHTVIQVSNDPAALCSSPAHRNLSELVRSTSEDMAENILNIYFKENGIETRKVLRPYLCKHIEYRKKTESFTLDEEMALSGSSSSDRSSDLYNPQLHTKISSLVASAVEEALKEERDINSAQEHKMQERVPRVRVALITGITSILSALITAGVTIAITFNTST